MNGPVTIGFVIFKDTHGDDLLSAAFTGVLQSVNVKPDELGDICVGMSSVFFSVFENEGRVLSNDSELCIFYNFLFAQ